MAFSSPRQKHPLTRECLYNSCVPPTRMQFIGTSVPDSSIFALQCRYHQYTLTHPTFFDAERYTIRSSDLNRNLFQVTPKIEGYNCGEVVSAVNDYGGVPLCDVHGIRSGHRLQLSHHSICNMWDEDGVTFNSVAAELERNGPVVASFFLNETNPLCSSLDSTTATNSIFQGFSRDDLTAAANAAWLHSVCLIGVGIAPDESDNYFICQNSEGGEWGDSGRFRLEPRSVYEIFVPYVEVVLPN